MLSKNYIKELRINCETNHQGEYYNMIPAIHSLNTLGFENKVTFFVGENGTGKSTLLEAIAISLKIF